MSFSGGLTIECVSLTNELCMIRPAFIDLNPAELNCYPFMISLDNCSGSCNNNEECQCECKKYRSCKNDYSWNPSTCICGKSEHWKRIVDDSVIAYDEIIYVMDIVSTNMTNTIPTNMTNTISTNVSTNSDGKKSKI